MLTQVFHARERYASNGREFSLSREKFFEISGIWVAIMEGDPLPDRSYNHVAFKILESEFDDYLRRIEALGLEVLKGRSRIKGEARSIYFYDFDNHLFELHTGDLEDRLSAYQGSADPDSSG